MFASFNISRIFFLTPGRFVIYQYFLRTFAKEVIFFFDEKSVTPLSGELVPHLLGSLLRTASLLRRDNDCEELLLKSLDENLRQRVATLHTITDYGKLIVQ